MSTEAIVVVLFGVTIIGGLVSFLILRTKWKWPEGTRISRSFYTAKAHLIYDEVAMKMFKIRPVTIAMRCAIAGYALHQAWEAGKDEGDKSVDFSEFVVHVLSDEAYDEIYDADLKRSTGNPDFKSAGTLVHIKAKMGSNRIPVVACRASNFDSTPETGGLVIHELTQHIIRSQGPGAHNADRSDPEFWLGSGKHTSLEGRARTLFGQYV